MTLQTIIEAAIIFTLCAAALLVSVNITSAELRMNVKLSCMEQNAEAIAELREAYYNSGDDGVFDYCIEPDGYTTAVEAVISTHYQETVLHRVEIKTTHNMMKEGVTTFAYITNR